MKNKAVIAIFILIGICIIIAAIILLNKDNGKNQIINSSTIDKIENTYTESEKEMDFNIRVVIDGKEYNAKLEQNDTVKSLISLLPKEFNMSELNENEKYVYLDDNLPNNPYNPRYIEAGDIMLFGNNCLVVFYKSFETSYSYTKIGHIQDLTDLGNKDIKVKFEKI